MRRDFARFVLTLAGIAALLAGGALALFALWGFVLVQPPDPFVPNGDPCCVHPDTWNDVWQGAAGVVLGEAAAGFLFAAGTAMLAFGVEERRPRRRTFVVVPAATALLAAVAVAIVVIPGLDEGRVPPDCDTFRFDARAWRGADQDARYEQAHGIALCDLVDGKTKAEVARLLGRPAPTAQGMPADGVTYWSYDGLTLFFEDDHVVRTTVGYG